MTDAAQQVYVPQVDVGLQFDAIRADGDPAAAKTPPSGGNLGTVEAMLRLLIDAGFAERRKTSE